MFKNTVGQCLYFAKPLHSKFFFIPHSWIILQIEDISSEFLALSSNNPGSWPVWLMASKQMRLVRYIAGRKWDVLFQFWSKTWKESINGVVYMVSLRGKKILYSDGLKHLNPSQYSVSIWNCTSTLNIELSTEKMFDHNYGITVTKKTARWQTHVTLGSNAPWLLKLHCLSCPPAHAQRHQPHPCRVLAIWKTCDSSAPLFINSVLYFKIIVQTSYCSFLYLFSSFWRCGTCINGGCFISFQMSFPFSSLCLNSVRDIKNPNVYLTETTQEINSNTINLLSVPR